MEEDGRWNLDNGSAVYALGELRRRLGSCFRSEAAELLAAVDRAASAIVQADSAKTVQEEVRHLVRALATAAEIYVLSAAHAKGLHDQLSMPHEVGHDATVTKLLAVVDHAHGAILQADGGTVQEEVRQLVRALAVSAQLFARAAAMTRKLRDEKYDARR
jgi:hypothetical protein